MLFVLVLSCCEKKQPRDIFDARGFKVITSFANSKSRTMSVLYGNDAAVSQSSVQHQSRNPDARYMLVTHEQADNPAWYGSYINGRLRCVEKVWFEDGHARYASGGRPFWANGKADASARIAFITSRTPSVFP